MTPAVRLSIGSHLGEDLDLLGSFGENRVRKGRFAGTDLAHGGFGFEVLFKLMRTVEPYELGWHLHPELRMYGRYSVCITKM